MDYIYTDYVTQEQMDEQTITIPKRQWISLKKQIQKLRKENEQFRTSTLAMSYSPVMISKNSAQFQSQLPMMKKMSAPQSKLQLKKSMSEWSKKLDTQYFKKKIIQPPEIEQYDDNEINIDINSEENEQFAILQQEPHYDDDLNEMKLFECVCVYGPNKQQVAERKHHKRSFAKSQLHYISSAKQRKKYEEYGTYLYPQGEIKVKKVREEEVMTQINRIIFKKNTKREDCLIYIFQKDQKNQLLKERNQVLETINPGKWLTAFCIQFNDYLTLNDDNLEIIEKDNQSFDDQSQVSSHAQQPSSSHNKSADLSKTIKMTQKKSLCIVSKFSLCIFTYFPLVSLIEQILISIVDQIKERRIAAYAKENQNIQGINIQFVISQLKEISNKLFWQISQIPPQIGAAGTLVVGGGEKVIHIQLTKNNLLTYFYSGWAYQLMKAYDKDKMYQIFCSILLQETVILVCQNLHILTYMIFFFVIGLPRPLYYPHPCVSVIFNLQLLDTPFIVTAGIHNTSKWLKQNMISFNEKISFIDLNKSEDNLFDKKKLVKSERLRKIFSSFYKKIDTPLFKKKDKIIKSTSKQENQTLYKFVRGINTYFHEEIFSYLPKKQLIAGMHMNVSDTNENNKISMLLKQIFKYIKQSRKQKEKDWFLSEPQEKDSLLNLIHKQSQIGISFFSTQMFSVFLADYYEFN